MPCGSTPEVFQSAGADSLAQATGLTLLEQDFESALAAIPSGYGEGVYEGLRYGVTVRKSRDGKRTNLFARALAAGDVVSFNLYRLRSGEDSLCPCEMPAEKVVAFVLGYKSHRSRSLLRKRRLVLRLPRGTSRYLGPPTIPNNYSSTTTIPKLNFRFPERTVTMQETYTDRCREGPRRGEN
jgi:hypothetical protein